MPLSGTNVEFAVAPKLNQGTVIKKGCNPRLNDAVGQILSGSFLGSFLDKQKLSEPGFMGLKGLWEYMQSLQIKIRDIMPGLQ